MKETCLRMGLTRERLGAPPITDELVIERAKADAARTRTPLDELDWDRAFVTADSRGGRSALVPVIRIPGRVPPDKRWRSMEGLTYECEVPTKPKSGEDAATTAARKAK